MFTGEKFPNVTHVEKAGWLAEERLCVWCGRKEWRRVWEGEQGRGGLLFSISSLYICGIGR